MSLKGVQKNKHTNLYSNIKTLDYELKMCLKKEYINLYSDIKTLDYEV